jgi:hypothetical protein
MNIDFDLGSVRNTEFGIGQDYGNDLDLVAVPVDAAVQAALRDMAQGTWDALQKVEDGLAKYEPSEKHGSIEYLWLPLVDEMASFFRELHEAENLNIDTAALEDPSNISCYFARLADKDGRRLTALRRATQFKGILKSRLIRFVSDSLQIIEDSVFKLDNDFDLLIDSTHVHILRPTSFELMGNLQQTIMNAVPGNIAAIRQNIGFVEFDRIEDYASKHTRAARYLASIREQTGNVDQAALMSLCQRTNIQLGESNGKVTVPAGSEMAFLEVLDRRRYEVTLVSNTPEQYRAGSRRKII